ncbi:hypothetical protein [Pectobacterium sp. B1J-3]|uniref:hypothetical protein n=1 Tax=Pectobacterium sp. B1J-3 TaxID=3385371 RepID=UPI003906454F
MEQIKNLVVTLEQCLPGLDIGPMLASLPESSEQGTVLDWLYEQLSEQGLMVYEEWGEYSGDIPELKPLSDLAISEDPAEFIFSLIEEIDWSTASVDPDELPYVMPWLEHINFYLKPYGVRLVDLLPFENAYILCLRDDETLLQKLHDQLNVLGMGINVRQSMDQEQVSAKINSLIYD